MKTKVKEIEDQLQKMSFEDFLGQLSYFNNFYVILVSKNIEDSHEKARKAAKILNCNLDCGKDRAQINHESKVIYFVPSNKEYPGLRGDLVGVFEELNEESLEFISGKGARAGNIWTRIPPFIISC